MLSAISAKTQFVSRRLGLHSTTAEARAACTADGGELLDLDNAEDARAALPEAFSAFRVQGISEGTCWIDGEGNEVDTDVAIPDDPNAVAPQTLVANVTTSSIEQVDEADPLPYICQQEKPVDGDVFSYRIS